MKFKRLVTLILTMVMIVTVVPAINRTDKVNATTEFTITSPGENALVGAGYFDIKWSEAQASIVKNYKLYIDGKLIDTTKNTSYEYYTTKVKMYSTYVIAEYENGSSETTPTVKFGVTKKGIGADYEMGRRLNPANLNIGWYYNWRVEPLSINAFKGYDFVPMIWGKAQGQGGTSEQIDTHLNNFINKGYKYVLGYNEPDYQNQANMTVTEILNLWPSFLNKDIRVGSPATAYWPNISEDWFQPFMEQVNAQGSNMYVDFIAIHCYPDNFQGKEMAEWFLEEVIDKTWEMYHKPIWITEFSTTGEVITQQGTIAFLKAVMPELDKREYVERYSYFSFNYSVDKSGLWNHYTGGLSEAGKVYAEYGNPEGYERTPVVEPTTKEMSTTAEIRTTAVNAKNTETVNVAKTKIIKVAAKRKSSNKAKVTLKKKKGVSGYQIQISKTNKFNKVLVKRTVKRVKVTINSKNIKNKSALYIRARTYVVVNKSKYYGEWSKVKKIKVRK